MPPVLTPDEIAQMTKESAKAISAASTFTNQIAAQQARAVELAKVDSAFKKYFDYYDGDIIVHYDVERKAIDGNYISAPITEADILSCANLLGGRIQPALPATDVIRIAQFDGTPLIVDPINEIQSITDQASAEDILVNGYGGSSPAMTILTDDPITPTSTTLKLKDLTTTFSIAPNSVFIVSDGVNFAVVKVLTFVMQVSPVPPPYIADLTIELLVAPVGTISSGQSLSAFTGFTNGERTAKIASDPDLQPLMDYLILELQTKINQRITRLDAQLPAIAANQDPDGVAELTQATTDVSTSKTFLTNYMITTDISDSGLSGLSSERGSRTTQANTRVSQITNAYTGRTLNYYDQRYNFANNRANTARGSLRLQKNSEAGAATSASYASTLGDQAAAMSSILP